VIWSATAQGILGNVTKGLNFTYMYKDAAHNKTQQLQWTIIISEPLSKCHIKCNVYFDSNLCPDGRKKHSEDIELIL
jgi:hypothetical protein